MQIKYRPEIDGLRAISKLLIFTMYYININKMTNRTNNILVREASGYILEVI